MFCTRILTRNIFHTKNLMAPIAKSQANMFGFSNFKPPLPTDIDTGNLAGLLNANETPYLTFWQKVAQFKWGQMYNGLDTFSRQFLFTVANDYGTGLPLGIISVSLTLRLLFFYPGIIAQVNGLKMKQLKPFMTRYQQKMQAAQMSRNKSLMKQASKQFNQVRQQRGIDTFIPLLNLMQLPLLITWFFSLRYITNLPEVYTQVQTEGFLWVKDLSAYDPYFILPLISATVMALSIIYSPAMNKQNITMPFMIPFIKYLKFLPFLSLPITAMFPAALNIYWCTVSFVQLATVGLLHTNFIKKKLGVMKQIQRPKIIQAAFIEQKRAEKVQSAFSDFKNQQNINKKSILNTTNQTQTLKISTSRPKKNK